MSLDRLEIGGYWAARCLSRAGLILLLIFAFSTLADGLLRSLFGAPLEAVRDLGNMVVAIAISACLPQVFFEKGNVVTSFIGSIVSKPVAFVVDVVANLVTTVVMTAFAWQFMLYANSLARVGERTPMFAIPKAPFWYLVALNFLMVAITQVIVTAQHIRSRSAITVNDSAPLGH